MKSGDKLTASSECKMDKDSRPTLTIGKEYIIEDFDDEDFMVIDDEGDYHWFPFDDIGLYFTIKQ